MLPIIKSTKIYKFIRKIYWRFYPPEVKTKEQEDFEYLKSCGVETEYGYVTLLGKPLIKKFPNSRIKIGKGAILLSVNEENGKIYNEAGVNHPVMISTSAEGAEIIIEDGVGMSGTSIVSCSKITIGKNTQLGINTNIFDTDFHSVLPEVRNKQKNVYEAETKPINIGENCWIGANSTILKGCNIGKGSTIGTMSLVTKDIPEDVLAVGIPAKVIRQL